LILFGLLWLRCLAHRGRSLINTRDIFTAEELEHPFSSVTGWLCNCEPSLEAHGPGRVRRALLALSLQSKAAKGLDGAAHGLASLGASAASAGTVSERLAAARDKVKRTPTTLRYRAACVARARAVQDGLEAVELCSFDQEEDWILIDDHLEIRIISSSINCMKIAFRYCGNADDLFAALHASPQRVQIGANATLLRTVVNSEFWRLAHLAFDYIVDYFLEDHSLSSKPIVCVGHSAGGSIAALVTALLAANGFDQVSAICLGPAPCATTRHFPKVRRITTIVLGDDLLPRASRASFIRLRNRLRRFLPKSGQSRVSLFGFSAAVAQSAIEHVVTPVTSSPTNLETHHSDELDLILPGHLFYLKPRADASLTVYALKSKQPSGGTRAELLWQLGDILLSKSMLAHHTLDAYLYALDAA